MRLLTRRVVVFLNVIILFSNLHAQSFSFNCARDTIVPGCPANLCITLKSLIPDLRGLSDSYTINPGSNIPGCFPVYVAPNDPAGDPTNLTIDDRYSSVITLPFTFPFYGVTYNSLVASTNGYLSFDITRATLFSHYQNFGDLPNSQYDKALIMGPYHDLDPSQGTSPNKRIQYQLFGVAPHRRWVLSFYKVPLYQCTTLIENTHQIILYESTGIIEVKIFDKQICASWQNGKAMVGLQDFTRLQGITAPQRKMSDPAWGTVGMNETWRFVPNSGNSLLKRVELYDLSNNLIATGTTTPISPGCLEASFANICAPAGATTSYIVKSVYQKIDDPSIEVFGTDTVRINRSVALTANATSTPAGCGFSNGTITVTGVTGGTPPYEYSLDGVTWQSGNVFTGLAAGGYTVYVRDVGAVCTTSVPINVGVSGNIIATTSVTSTSCTNINNGSITVTSVAGTGPYRFSIDGGPLIPGTIPYTFSNLSPGNHTVVVNDLGTSCTTGPMIIYVPAGLGVSANAIPTPTSCASSSDGSITLTVVTGTAPFTYQLDGGPIISGSNPYIFTNVSAGTHNIRITDNLGCFITISITVNAGSSLTANISNTSTACSGINNGTITVNVLNGTAPYTFKLDANPPQPGPNPYTFTNVAAGTHTITVTDVTNCSMTSTTTVVVGPGITGNVSTTATACTGVNNGTITVNATSGTAPFTFQLDAGTPQSGANPYTFTNVASGSHTITVTDNLGCTFTSTATVSVGAGVTGNLTSTATSCQVSVDGTITANATAGTPPFTYQLDGGAQQSGANPYTFTNVTAGPHSVVIRDNFGCLTTLSITVVAGPALTGTTASTATSCSGATNGSITVTATSGTAPFQFALDGGAYIAGASPHTFNNVPAGSHTVVIKDSWGCTSNPLSVNVTAGPPLTTTVNKTDVLCFGGSTGSIIVTVPVIGTPPYQYSLDNINWQASNVFNGLPAGAYTVYYRESNGCQGSQPITINQPAAALSASASMIPVVCNGQNNGTITVTAAGGTSPYTYSLDGGAYQSSNVFNTTAGIHNLSIRDANGCTTSNTITVTQPAVLTAVANIQDASCNGGNDGIITIVAGGGNAGYQYSLDGINFRTIDSFHVAPGNYVVTIKDNLGCTTTRNATVNLASNFTMTPQVDQTICEGTSAQLQLQSNATQFAWSPATGLSNTNTANPVANPVTTTQYIVTATLDRCSATDTIIVNVNAAPIPNAGPDGFICYGQSYQLQASGGTSFSWIASPSLSNTTTANPVARPVQTTTYTLSVVDANGCSSLITDDVKVDVTPPIKVSTYPRDTILYTGEQVQLLATSAGTIYNWSPTRGLSNPNIPDPIVTAGPMGDVVLYTVTASTIAGCQGVGYIKVQVYKGPDIYMPTAFTPNNDGKNDIFKPFTVGIEKINYFKVFNRWGQMIYSTSAINEGWNGKLGSTDQPSGVYVWMVQGITKDGKIITKRGTIALIR